MNEKAKSSDFLKSKNKEDSLEKENTVMKKITYRGLDGNKYEEWSSKLLTGDHDIPGLRDFKLEVLRVEEFPRMKRIPPGASSDYVRNLLNDFLEKNNLTTDDVERCDHEVYSSENTGFVNNNTHYNNFVYLKDGRKMELN